MEFPFGLHGGNVVELWHTVNGSVDNNPVVEVQAKPEVDEEYRKMEDSTKTPEFVVSLDDLLYGESIHRKYFC